MIVDGIQKRGVIKKRRGRTLTIEWKSELKNPSVTETFDVDQAKVHKL